MSSTPVPQIRESLLPSEFVSRLRQIVPEEFFPEILASFERPKRTIFRVNRLKITPDALEKELKSAGLHPIPFPSLEGVFTLPDDERRRLTETPAFYEGRLYIQNPSSMLAPLLLNPQPEESVLDLAAAPGGKTLLLASMMQNRGILSAVEPVTERYHRLRRNLENAGATMVRTYRKDGRGVGRACPLMFDRVLLDAPCSSEAKFSTLRPQSFSYWSPRKIKESQRLQKRLILSAWESLKPGGTLLYSTCSFAPEENEEVLLHLLKKFPESARIAPMELPVDRWQEGLRQWGKKSFPASFSSLRRILPDENFDGFFLAKIVKEG
ncbi:RsmB/NOP family class I SAM-dependent RNA methyltransferase [Nitratifractor sp.]